MKNKLLYISILVIFSAGLFYSGWKMLNGVVSVSENNILESTINSDGNKKKSVENKIIVDVPKANAVASETDEKEVSRYGVIRTHSTSGELRLSYYDMEQGKALESSQGHPWFFATPQDIEDRKGAVELFDYVEKNKDSVFKIVGLRDSDDCGYYGNDGPCLESIIIKKIDVVAK